ncbi:motility associated factor glycosyltransferase family protein [Paenibacillus alkalitolerans]|uniref:motility associated factor glycosyltransferase family protein n=1 Tax=Paenibacillus alkalitolerans TaxID=2799335 RepID=UPI0018F6F87A|nr:6-hydroxymethylpterin diphosphokinase MptE-like protein [Paenibacillus alkalitolerans]
MIDTYTITESFSDQGEKVFVYEEGARRIPLGSLYSSKREAQKFADTHSKRHAVFVLIGYGNGDVVQELIRRGEYLHLFILEPFEEIEFLNEHCHTDRVTVDHYTNFAFLTASFRRILERYRGVDFQIMFHPHYDRTNPEYMKSVLLSIHRSVELVRLNYITQMKYRKEWLLEPILNLEYNREILQLQELRGHFVGQKAILAAAGPSLKDSIPYLSAMQKSAYIFAAGSAVNGLTSHGINPDFTVTYDSSETNFEAHFKDTRYEGPMFIGTTANSNIIRNFKGPVILFGLESDDISKRFFPALPYLPSVPSVANVTLNILNYLGFSEVYLVGQDLAFQNGSYYAEGVRYHSAAKTLAIEFEIDSNSGEKVGTNSMLYAFLETFNGMISMMDPERIKIYNLAKHGAKIQGAPYLPAEQFPFSFVREERDLKRTLAASTETGREAVDICMAELKKLYKQLKEVLRKLRNVSEYTATVKELKLVLRHLVRLRENEWYEGVILNQFSYSLQRLNNFFEYEMDKPEYSNEDRVRMVKEVKNMIQETSDFLEKFLNESKLQPFL